MCTLNADVITRTRSADRKCYSSPPPPLVIIRSNTPTPTTTATTEGGVSRRYLAKSRPVTATTITTAGTRTAMSSRRRRRLRHGIIQQQTLTSGLAPYYAMAGDLVDSATTAGEKGQDKLLTTASSSPNSDLDICFLNAARVTT